MTATAAPSTAMTAAPADPSPALRDRIADIARRSEAPFVAAGSMLMSVVEALDRVIADLEAMSDAVDRTTASASIVDLERVADRLLALPEMHEVRAARMGSIDQAAKTLEIDVTTAGRTLRMLGIFGMNIGVASEGEPEFAGFAQHMSQKLTEGERHLGGMTKRLGDLAHGIAAMRGADNQLSAESAHVVPQVPNRLIQDAAALGEYLAASAAAAEQVAVTARRVRDQIAVMLGAMQVGDRTRQRLEHVAAGLEMLDGLQEDGTSTVAAMHFRRLLIAQMEATANDFDRDALLLADVFAALQPDAQHLLELMQDGSGAGGTASLAELESGIGEVLRLTQRLCAADDRAHMMHRLVADAIVDLGQGLDGVRRLRSNVQVIATNIALLCRRHGQIGRGVSAIADQIDVQAAALPHLTENVARSIDLLTTVSDAMRQDGSAPMDAAATLSGALAILREGVRRSEAAAARRPGDEGRRLIAMIGGAADRITHERDLAAQICDCAAALTAQTTLDSEADADDLAALMPALHRLAALYTMAQEREVHAGFLPPGEAAAPAAPLDDDDDDDGLF